MNCGNEPFYLDPCAIGVLFCDPLVTSHNGQTSEYYLMKKFHIRYREGCGGHDFIPTGTSVLHACSKCDPEGFALLDRKLAANNGDVDRALVCATSSVSQVPGPSEGQEDNGIETNEKTAEDEGYEGDYEEESDDVEEGEEGEEDEAGNESEESEQRETTDEDYEDEQDVGCEPQVTARSSRSFGTSFE